MRAVSEIGMSSIMAVRNCGSALYLYPSFRRKPLSVCTYLCGVSAKHPYTSRPRSGEREGPIAKQWEGEGHPCCLFLRRRRAVSLLIFSRSALHRFGDRTKGPGAPHPPNAHASGPSLSPLSRG